jgi:hypothetical protein
MTLGVAALGVVQFRLPQDHFLNRYDQEVESVTGQYGRVRAVGTFSYIGGMTVMAEAGSWAATYLFLSSTTALRRLLAVAVAVASVSCSLVAMSRTGLVLALVNVVGGAICFRRARGVVFVALIGVAAYWLFWSGSASETAEVSAFSATMRRFEESDSFMDRLLFGVYELQYALSQWPLGAGLGAGQPGAAFAVGMHLSDFRVVESEQGRIIYEVGLPGLLSVLLIRLLVFWRVLVELLHATNPVVRALYAASFPMILTSFLGNLAFNHTGSSMTWCVITLVFGAMKIDCADQRSAEPRARLGPMALVGAKPS